MFFLILLGRGCSEKNCAGFRVDLREFSRAVVGARLAGVDAAGRLAGKTDARLRASPWPRDGCSNPVCQGFRGLLAVTLTVELHRVPIGRGRRMSTTPRPSRRSGSRAHRSIAQHFEWRRGRDVHIRNRHAVRPGVDAHRWNSQRDEWVLTVDIHILAGSFRRSAVHPHRSNTQGREWVRRADIHAGIRMLRDYRFALTVEMHRASTGCGGCFPRPDLHCQRAVRVCSPVKITALRVAWGAGYPHRGKSADRSRRRVSSSAGDAAIHAGGGWSPDRTLTLTVEKHSAASRFGGRISTLKCARCA